MDNVQWISTLKSKYVAGISNVFVLTGNIGDYATPGILFLDYLVKSLVDMGMNEVFTFDLSEEIVEKFSNIPEAQNNYNPQLSKWDTMINDLRDKAFKRAYIILYPEFLLPSASSDFLQDPEKQRIVGIHKAINNSEFLTSDNILIFVSQTKSEINPMFFSSTSRTVLVKVNYPNETERLGFIHYLRSTGSNPVKWELTELEFANLAAGLNRINLEDIYLLAETTGTLTRQMIMERKTELIEKEYGEIIEIFDTEGFSLDKFAGQENIKDYHREIVIEPILSGDSSIVPKGMLYMGPPGTGKTYFARCLAGDAKINFVEFKMSKILDKWVGNAEKNLEKAFTCFESLAPVGVFIDEIDQALSRGESDGNSVQGNLFGMFLSFLSEASHRGKILFIGATNYPNKLDEALKRAGRFDKKIPFFPPDKEERKEVFKIHLKKSGFTYSVNDYNTLADLTDNYTQAEIENVVVKALEVSKRKKYPSITDETMTYALECIVSAQNIRIEEMINIALDECNDKEFLPEHYKKRLSIRGN